MVSWLKEYEYIATWLGFLLAIISLLPLRAINWRSLRWLSLLLALIFSALAAVFLHAMLLSPGSSSAGAGWIGCFSAALGYWRRVFGRA